MDAKITRFISFRKAGQESFGVWTDDGVIDLSSRSGHATLKEAIAAGALDELAALAADVPAPDHACDSLQLLPVIPQPGKILCVGLNYHDHVAETGRELTVNPALFVRFPESQVAHGDPILVPAISEKLDYEGELALVIGKGGRNIAEADALAHVAGYACYNDGSVRDWQYHTTQFTAGKNFVGTGAFGPWLIPASEIGDVGSLRLETRLNGTVMQSATVDMMITPIARQIAYISTFTPLAPGDVIITGTPGGVGAKRNPPVFLKPGDLIEVEVDRIGVLSNRVMAETAA